MAEMSIRDNPDSSRFELWIDGVLAGQDLIGAAPTSQAANLHIGTNDAGAIYGGCNIAHALVYDKALDAPEIEQISDEIGRWVA